MNYVLHIRNTMNTIIRFIDWVTDGYVSDLQYQLEMYKAKHSSMAKRINHLVSDNNHLLMEVQRYKEKEARIKQQKRESYHRNKNK